MMLAITNAKLLTITAGTIEGGTLLLENGKISVIGQGIEIPKDAKIIDGTGKWVTPGLIDAHSHIGLFGEPTVPATADGNEKTGPVQSYLRGLDSLNPQDPAFPQVVAAGVTTVYTGPGSSNIIGGTGMAIKLRGRTAEEMLIPGTEGMKMALGENPKRNYAEQKQIPSTRMGNAAVLREALQKAKEYVEKIDRAVAEAPEGTAPKLPERDLKLEMLGKVIKREQKARIHAHRADDIMTAIRIAEEFGLDFSIEHATEGYKIADILAEKQVQCVVGPLLMGPAKHELWEVRLDNPAELVKAGVKVAIQVDSSSDTQYLGIQAGIAVREGLPMDDAFRCITINAAEIIGVADRIGSLEVGKDADVAVFDGNPLCNFTNCLYTIIDGKIVHEVKQ